MNSNAKNSGGKVNLNRRDVTPDQARAALARQNANARGSEVRSAVRDVAARTG